jgi:nitronate monooxygenase
MTYDTSWRTTAATRALDIELPLVLGAFGGASSVELTALVSERGGLGSYGLYGYSAERIAEVARALRGATSKPFALNIWLPLDGNEQVEVTDEQFAAYLKPLLPYFAAVGVEPPAGPPERYLPSFDEQIEAVLDCAPAVVSFVYGVPPAPILDRARALGIRTMATATTVEEAIALDDAGIDAIIASGAEAGGHRVSFLRPAQESLVGTFALIPLVADAVRAPVIAAGGIADGRGLRAALALGADAVLVGSAFLATRQSGAAPVHRAALTSAAAGSTVLTYAMSGRLGRGIANRMTTELRTVGDVAPFPIQNWLTGQFRPAAGTRGMTDYMSLWAGQSSPLIIHDDADALIDALIAAGDG